MIYLIPKMDDPLDQGDLIEECPVSIVIAHAPNGTDTPTTKVEIRSVILLTQTCDFANAKAEFVVVAPTFDVQGLVARGRMKVSEIKGPIRAGRVWGLYFLPANDGAGITEMIVDFRQLYSLPFSIVDGLRSAGKRRARLTTPYREHLAKHFADTYARIGLPQPYETMP